MENSSGDKYLHLLYYLQNRFFFKNRLKWTFYDKSGLKRLFLTKIRLYKLIFFRIKN